MSEQTESFQIDTVAQSSEHRRGRGLAVVAAVAAVFLLLGSLLFAGAVWGVAAYEQSQEGIIAEGVSAYGLPLGGLTRAEAEQRLQAYVNDVLSRPLEVRHGDTSWATTAGALGVRLSTDEMLARAFEVGRQGNVVERLQDRRAAKESGRTVNAEASMDAAVVEAHIAHLADEVEKPVRDAWLRLDEDGEVTHGTAQIGLVVDVAASRDRVLRALESDTRAVDLVSQAVEPRVTDAAVTPVRATLEQLLGTASNTGPRLRLTFREREWPLYREDLATLVDLVETKDPARPYEVAIDEALLADYAFQLGHEVHQEGQEARFAWDDGQLEVLRESREWHMLDRDAAAEAIRTKLLAGGGTLALPVAVDEPQVSSEDPTSLGIVELIEKGSTSFAGSQPEKIQNIKLAAERLNGAVVPPGGTFSFNKEIGPTTLDAGFTWGFGITSGTEGVKTVPSVAGGICQVATTLFHPVFWSGYQLEQRTWHLYWIPGYASKNVVGTDVTVDEEAGLDFKWSNPTDDYILIQARTTQDQQIEFALYGKKPDWTVQVAPPKITDRVAPDPAPVRQEEPSLALGRTIQVEAAREGFKVELTRTVTRPGEEPRVLNMRSTYQPSRNVTLVGTGGRPPSAATAEESPADDDTRPRPAAQPATDAGD